MSELLASNILYAALFAFYFFVIIPIIGYALGTSLKSYWCGYDYEPCLGRGLAAHAVLFVAYILIKAAIVKLF